MSNYKNNYAGGNCVSGNDHGYSYGYIYITYLVCTYMYVCMYVYTYIHIYIHIRIQRKTKYIVIYVCFPVCGIIQKITMQKYLQNTMHNTYLQLLRSIRGTLFLFIYLYSERLLWMTATKHCNGNRKQKPFCQWSVGHSGNINAPG